METENDFKKVSMIINSITYTLSPIDIISLLNAFTVMFALIIHVYSRSPPQLHGTNTIESDNMHVHGNTSYLTAPSHVTTSGPQAVQNTGDQNGSGDAELVHHMKILNMLLAS